MSAPPAAPDLAGASAALFSARALVDELVRGGVRHVCVAPGSRSTALALAVAECAGVTAHVLTDERSMGFFALGLARATADATAIVCTSGTAAANLLPAVVESALGGGALVLLTADRPPELRDCAAPQTIDQAGLFGSHSRWSVDVPLLETTTAAARTLRSLGSRALATAIAGRGGPVHLNVPLREPFTDDTFPMRGRFETAAREHGLPFTSVAGRPSISAGEAADLAARLSRAERGVIVCAGPGLPAASVAALAAALGWPVLADPLSGMRFGGHDRTFVTDACEPLLRDEAMRAALRPDCIVRFGLTPAPRGVQRWLDESWPAEHIVVTGGSADWPDPVRAASVVVRADAGDFCVAIAGAIGRAGTAAAGASLPADPAVLAIGRRAWLDRWRSLSAASRHALDAGLDSCPVLFDAVVLRALAGILPHGASLVVGNSMPVRDADGFLAASDRELRVFANRGASGIDGVLSTALGIAAASDAPTALVIGDLSFLHDASALALAAREHIPLLVVVVNNDGGGIFSFLPLRDSLAASAASDVAPAADAAGRMPAQTASAAGEVFERFFGTPHGTDLECIASTTGGFFARVTDRAGLDAALRAGLAAAAGGPAVVEVRTDREAGRRAQLSIVAAAQAAAGARRTS